jgi:diguanylate cyclase (GGDEF)-like protein
MSAPAVASPRSTPRSPLPRLRARSCALALLIALPAALASMLAAAQGTADPAAQANALLARVETEVEIDPRRALGLARRAVDLAGKAGDPDLLRRARIEACDVAALVDARSALAEADAGLARAAETGDASALAGFRSCRGYALDLQGKPAEAALEFETAVVQAERAGDRALLADALALRGESRHYHGRYDEAIADLDRAYAINLELGLKDGQRYTLNAIANVYSDANVGEYDKAIGYYRQLLKYDEAAGLTGGIATTRYNIAGALEMKGELAAALQEYRRALELDASLDNRAGKAQGERAIGALLVRQERAGEALPWIERAMTHFAEVDDVESMARTRLTRARALHALGRRREAVVDLEFVERHFRASGNPRQLAKVHEIQAEVHAALGEWKRAYEASAAHRRMQEELEKRAREEQTTRLRVQFDTARKEQENRALLIENAHRGEALRNAERVRSLQRLAILLGAALFAVLGAMALLQVNRGRRLKQLAMTDELTALPNRRHILEFFERALRTAREQDGALSVIAFDVDHFKRINDLHGHHGGDRALQRIAQSAQTSLPEGARVGRMGGEEFLAVLPGVAAGPAMAAAERLRLAIAEDALDGFRDGERITISLGVVAAGPEDDSETLLKRADGALYRAKREGRDRAVAG